MRARPSCGSSISRARSFLSATLIFSCVPSSLSFASFGHHLHHQAPSVACASLCAGHIFTSASASSPGLRGTKIRLGSKPNSPAMSASAKGDLPFDPKVIHDCRSPALVPPSPKSPQSPLQHSFQQPKQVKAQYWQPRTQRHSCRIMHKKRMREGEGQKEKGMQVRTRIQPHMSPAVWHTRGKDPHTPRHLATWRLCLGPQGQQARRPPRMRVLLSPDRDACSHIRDCARLLQVHERCPSFASPPQPPPAPAPPPAQKFQCMPLRIRPHAPQDPPARNDNPGLG